MLQMYLKLKSLILYSLSVLTLFAEVTAALGELNLPFLYFCRTKTRGKAIAILIFLCQGKNKCVPLWSVSRLELEELPLCSVQFKRVTANGFQPAWSQPVPAAPATSCNFSSCSGLLRILMPFSSPWKLSVLHA